MTSSMRYAYLLELYLAVAVSATIALHSWGRALRCYVLWVLSLWQNSSFRSAINCLYGFPKLSHTTADYLGNWPILY